MKYVLTRLIMLLVAIVLTIAALYAIGIVLFIGAIYVIYKALEDYFENRKIQS